MAVHSLHIFDRKGKTLFSKTYSKAAAIGQQQLRQTSQGPAEEDPVDEQRKLVFGMLFSLRELVGSLAPEGEKGGEWRGGGVGVRSWCNPTDWLSDFLVCIPIHTTSFRLALHSNGGIDLAQL